MATGKGGSFVVTPAMELVASLVRTGMAVTEGDGKPIAAVVLSILTIGPVTGGGQWYIQPGWTAAFASGQEAKMLRDLAARLIDRAELMEPGIEVVPS